VAEGEVDNGVGSCASGYYQAGLAGYTF